MLKSTREFVSVKFMDDASAACSIDLQKSLIKDPVERERPLNFYEKNGLILPDSRNPVLPILQEIKDFTDDQKMKVNENKTKLMTFNLTRNFQFPIEIGFKDSTNLEVVSSSRILGVIISNNLKWDQNTEFITRKAMSRLWTLRRMKNLGLPNNIIFEVYTKEIRSVLEFAVPVWNGALTSQDSSKIESIQKKAFKILLQSEYTDYLSACELFNVETLVMRRKNMCLKFAKKEFLRESSIFIKFQQKRYTRLSEKTLVQEIKCNSNKYFNSSIPYLSRLLNNDKQ